MIKYAKNNCLKEKMMVTGRYKCKTTATSNHSKQKLWLILIFKLLQGLGEMVLFLSKYDRSTGLVTHI